MKKLSQCPYCLHTTQTIQGGICEKCRATKILLDKDSIEKAVRLANKDQKKVYDKGNNFPVGVSQWKNRGINFGYWSYFEKQIESRVKKDIINKIKKWNESGYYSDCIGKYGWRELLGIIESIN